MKDNYEVVIVGMGPAGAAAALELTQLGINVAVVDENTEPGGQIYRQFPADFTVTDPRLFGAKYKNAQKLIRKIRTVRKKTTIISDTYVWGFFNNDTLSLIKNDKISQIRFRKMLLAEGAMERSIPFPGWTLPGIMTLGGLQKCVVQQRLLPGRRFLLAGCSPLIFQVAATLVKAGAEIAAVCDPVPPSSYLKIIPQLMSQRRILNEVLTYFYPLIGKSVSILRPFAIEAASGDDRVKEVSVVKLDDNWRPIPSSRRSFEVDIVGVSFGFLPLARLARLCGCSHTYDSVQKAWRPKTDKFLRSNLSDIYIAGDSSGIGGADMSSVEGQIAAVHIACYLGRISTAEMNKRIEPLIRKRDRIQKWAIKFNETFSPQPGLYHIVQNETVVCRCEDVTAGEIREGIEMGYKNINEIKRTRIGMGLCQGRTCENIVQQLMLQKNIPIEEIGYLNLRPPLSPIQLSALEANSETGV